MAWPPVARAQQTERQRRLGVIIAVAEDDPEARRWVAVFARGLRELGWMDGGNIQIDYRWPGADAAHIRDAEVELISLKPDVILAQSPLTLAPLQRMTTKIPIVFLQIGDPVGSGVVASLARPGGNITGFTPLEFSMGGKMLEVLKETAPAIRRVTVVYNPVQAGQVGLWNAVEAAAPALSVQVNAASAINADEIGQIIEAADVPPGGASGVIVMPNPVTIANRGSLIALAARHRLPAIYAFPFFVKEGGLVSYGSDPGVQYYQAASYVDRILKGAKPEDLPVQQPTKFDLAVNVTTAKALGLTIPESLLSLADEIFE